MKNPHEAAPSIAVVPEAPGAALRYERPDRRAAHFRVCEFGRMGGEVAKRKKIDSPEVARVFETYPKELKTKLLFLRQLIFDVASETEGVGELQETLKWGQPSYLTSQSKSGSAIRIDHVKLRPGRYAMYFHCQTTLVDTFKEMFRGAFEFEGNRAIVFEKTDRVPVKELRHCISLALTYHLDKKSPNKQMTRRSTGRAQRRRAPIR